MIAAKSDINNNKGRDSIKNKNKSIKIIKYFILLEHEGKYPRLAGPGCAHLTLGARSKATAVLQLIKVTASHAPCCLHFEIDIAVLSLGTVCFKINGVYHI